MASPADQVDEAFDKATSYALAAQNRVNQFTNMLNESVYVAPTLSVNWNSIAPPSLDSMPDHPAMPAIEFNMPDGEPGQLAITPPDVVIDDFNEEAPTLTFPLAPTLSYGAVPDVPDISAVTVPIAPTITTPGLPTFLTVSTVDFAGVDLHEDWLDKLNDIPALSLVAPTPYTYTRGPEYASALLASLKDTLATRIAGGTGLNPAVEAAIWDRARSRETSAALANESDITRSAESFGFIIPPGAIAAQLRDAQRDYYDKVSGLSRDIAIKQADLEQENLKQAIEQGMTLESKLIDYSFQLENLSFENAKAVADNAVQVYTAQVQAYTALLDGYRAYSDAYRTLIEGEMAKIEVYKAQLQGEQMKADINKSLVDMYNARIQTGVAQVEIYKAQVDAASTLVALEEAKISAAGEQIKAYVAQVNAETSKVEAYKASVQAQATQVDIYRTKADAFSAKSGAQAERARAELARYTAIIQAKSAEWDGYRAKIQAEAARIDALGRQSSALLDGYRAAATAVTAKAEMYTKLWEVQIKDYESAQYLTLQTARFNADAINATNQARLDASKVGAQVYAQLTASAYSMINASASVSAASNNGISYSYSGEVDGKAPIKTSV